MQCAPSIYRRVFDGYEILRKDIQSSVGMEMNVFEEAIVVFYIAIIHAIDAMFCYQNFFERCTEGKEHTKIIYEDNNSNLKIDYHLVITM